MRPPYQTTVLQSHDPDRGRNAGGPGEGAHRAVGTVDVQPHRAFDAIRVHRGPFATGEGSADVFVVRGDRAVKVPVTFGLSSQTYFEVTSGLTPGDEVIVSDMRDYLRLREVRLR